MISGTGFSNYDRLLVDAVKRWRYRPYMVAGVASAVCTGVTFVYTQQNQKRDRTGVRTHGGTRLR